jgi:hypothetical protein
MGYLFNDGGVVARFYVGTEEFSVFQKVRTGSLVHPVLLGGFRNSIPQSLLRSVESS